MRCCIMATVTKRKNKIMKIKNHDYRAGRPARMPMRIPDRKDARNTMKAVISCLLAASMVLPSTSTAVLAAVAPEEDAALENVVGLPADGQQEPPTRTAATKTTSWSRKPPPTRAPRPKASCPMKSRSPKSCRMRPRMPRRLRKAPKPPLQSNRRRLKPTPSLKRKPRPKPKRRAKPTPRSRPGKRLPRRKAAWSSSPLRRLRAGWSCG